MLKKILATLLFLIPATTAFSAGPYVGAGVGVQTNTSSTGLNYRGVPFNVFLGYGAALNSNFYLGGEVLGTLGTYTLSDSSLLKTSYSYGFSFLPGLLLADHTIAYARAGVLRARFSSGNGTTVNAGQLGLGLQTRLTQHWGMRGEYVY